MIGVEICYYHIGVRADMYAFFLLHHIDMYEQKRLNYSNYRILLVINKEHSEHKNDYHF